MFGRDSWSSWTRYTPVFTAGTGTIGNGSTFGMWKRMGDSICVFLRLRVGSTTTFQAGEQLQLSLPPGLSVSGGKQLPNSGRVVGDAFFLDASNRANDRAGLPTCFVASISGIAESSNGNTVTDTVPWTWTTDDEMILSGVVPVVGY